MSWSSTNADSVEIDQSIGPVPHEGSREILVNETTTYTITATNAYGSATDLSPLSSVSCRA